jgi:hypothetical protein
LIDARLSPHGTKSEIESLQEIAKDIPPLDSSLINDTSAHESLENFSDGNFISDEDTSATNTTTKIPEIEITIPTEEESANREKLKNLAKNTPFEFLITSSTEEETSEDELEKVLPLLLLFIFLFSDLSSLLF